MLDAGRRLCSYVHATTTSTAPTLYRLDVVGACVGVVKYTAIVHAGGLFLGLVSVARVGVILSMTPLRRLGWRFSLLFWSALVW